MNTHTEQQKLLFVPSGTKARQVTEEEYDTYDASVLTALNITEFIKVPGFSNEIVSLSFLHDFRYRPYQGKNFVVTYHSPQNTLLYNVTSEHHFDDYFEAKRKFDAVLMHAKGNSVQ